MGSWLRACRTRIVPFTLHANANPPPDQKQQDWTYQAGSDEGEGVDWCTTAEAAPKWTSEKGSVMLDGHPVFLKGINWCAFAWKRGYICASVLLPEPISA